MQAFEPATASHKMASTVGYLCRALLLLAVVAGAEPRRQGVPMSVRHERWMARFGRTYGNAAEKARRFEVFKANAEHVEVVNRAGNRTYTLGLNQFSDLTDDEFVETHLGYRGHGRYSEEKPAASAETALGDAPDSVDWRAQGAVAGVKNQGTCGSCWAFAAVAATEGLVQIATGNLLTLSEQQVLDCTGGANTCDGGSVGAALRYAAASGGLQAGASYTYHGAQGACRGARSNPAASISGFRLVRLSGDEATLQRLAAQQPVAVIVEASDPDFRHYSSGVYVGSGACGRRLNHAVTVVGYGMVDDGSQYWMLKNQWGTWWGERGYMRIARGGDGSGAASCGLATYAYYPTIHS